jgi:tetratricopeptide (TPR) repeat protein
MTGTPSSSKPPKKPARRSKAARASSGDQFDLSGDFRGAVINIKSTIVSNEEVKDLENLPPEPGEPPFQGMQYFDEKDADRFFGRETLIAKIVGRLTSTRFLTIIGASGSGKSSVVRAGVIPALRRGERLADGSMPPTNSGQWDIRVFTPTAHPLDALAASLTPESDSLAAMTGLRQDLSQDSQTLINATQYLLAQTGRKHLLLVIDQFEEIFTQCRQEEERRAFIENLLQAADPNDMRPITILLTLRADFYAQLSIQDALRELVSQNQEFIGAMSRQELSRAILQPAALGNWKVQEGLVEVMLDDLGSEPGALPLLSHALLETWKRRRGRVMTLSGYIASGGVHGAIAQTAETVFRQRLTAGQQPIARMIFIKLAEMGEGSLDTRRRATFSELLTRSIDITTIELVLSILTEARLVTISTMEPGETRVVEVSHEALIREWPTLRDWLNENREDLILHRQLTEDTNDWLKLNRDPGALYRGMRLQQALEWAGKNTELISLSEQEFLEASQKAAREEQGQLQRLARARRMQIVLGGAAMLLVAGIVILILAVNEVFVPSRMDGVFNIAVAEFGVMGPDGQIRASASGGQISGWAVNYLREQLKDDPNLLVWPNQGNLFNQTRVEMATPETAERIAQDINASMLLYGFIDTRQDLPQLVLRFWIAPQAKYRFEDIQGNFSLGEPIRIADLNQPGISVQGELERQSSALAWLGIGLAQEQLGQAEEALQAFLRAAEFAPQSEAVQFFIGREYLFLSERHPDRKEEYWQAAEDALQKAISANDQYARTYIALGALYFKQAATMLEAANDSGQVVDPQASEWAQQSMEAYQTVLDLKPDPEEYGIPLQEVAQSALGNAYRLKGAIAYNRGDHVSALDSVEQAIQQLEAVRPVFEAAVRDHESYRRYLTQVYEQLGVAYELQGKIFEHELNYPQALESYTKSLNFYSECIAQGPSSDLIIQNDIIGKYCQPYSQTTKEALDNVKEILAGGS